MFIPKRSKKSPTVFLRAMFSEWDRRFQVIKCTQQKWESWIVFLPNGGSNFLWTLHLPYIKQAISSSETSTVCLVNWVFTSLRIHHNSSIPCSFPVVLRNVEGSIGSIGSGVVTKPQAHSCLDNLLRAYINLKKAWDLFVNGFSDFNFTNPPKKSKQCPRKRDPLFWEKKIIFQNLFVFRGTWSAPSKNSTWAYTALKKPDVWINGKKGEIQTKDSKTAIFETKFSSNSA